MRVHPIELQLPLDPSEASSLAHRRVAHLEGVDGVDQESLVRLLRTFPSLRGVYAAPEPELARVIGPVAAARLRWFLDAPLDTVLAREQLTSRRRRVAATLSSAA